METGYKVFRKEILEQIKLVENRFGIEPELTAKISRVPNVRIYEVGIAYFGRTYAEGKKIGLKTHSELFMHFKIWFISMTEGKLIQTKVKV